MTRSVRLGHATEELRELRRAVDHLLEVVEEQQHLSVADVLGQAVLGTECLRDRLGDEPGSRSAASPTQKTPALYSGTR